MPNLQTKALVVTPISGDNFLELFHPIVWLVRQVCSDKAEFGNRLFMANMVVRIESEVFVGVGRFTVDTCL